MNLTLTREPADGLSVRGVLSQDPSRPPLLRGGDGIRVSTLENAAYLIPCGTYPLTVTYSPRFKRPLPLVCNVPVLGSGPATLRKYGVHPLPLVSDANDLGKGCPQGGKGAFRSGIRFHRGSKPEHSRGCILVSRADEDRLTALLTNQTSTLTIV